MVLALFGYATKLPTFTSRLKQRLIDCHKQNWNHLIQDSSRCIHYNEFKSLLNTERYLKLIYQ